MVALAAARGRRRPSAARRANASGRAARASISRFCASVPRRNAYSAPPTAFTLAAANRAERSAEHVVAPRGGAGSGRMGATRSRSSPWRRAAAEMDLRRARAAPTRGRCTGSMCARHERPITTCVLDADGAPPSGTVRRRCAGPSAGRLRGSLATSQTSFGRCVDLDRVLDRGHRRVALPLVQPFHHTSRRGVIRTSASADSAP